MEFATAENGWIMSIAPSSPALIAKAWRILKNNRFCTLSTCSAAGMPWAAPLLFGYDADLTIYWSSAIAALHSQHLVENQGRGAIVIYDSTATTGNVAGLYLTGVASEVSTDCVAGAMQLLFTRLEKPPQRTAADYLKDSPRRMYQFCPQAIWMTGERVAIANQLVDTKVALNLTDLIQESN